MPSIGGICNLVVIEAVFGRKILKATKTYGFRKGDSGFRIFGTDVDYTCCKPLLYIVKRTLFLILILSACSPKVQVNNLEATRPSWLKTEPFQDGYYTGIGHSVKEGDNNYIQTAKKSALDDLVSEIKVTVSSTSVLNTLEVDRKIQEKYEQMIQTTAKDEIEDFELVDAWEDEKNYWVYYRLSISRYKNLKEEQKRTATILSTDYFKKAREAENQKDIVQALSYYFQALKSIEKYIGEAITVKFNDRDVLLVNEIHSSIQDILKKITIEVTPKEIALNRRITSEKISISVASHFDGGMNLPMLPLNASFTKGAGDIFPSYKTDEKGKARILINSIGSKELEQIVSVTVDIDSFVGSKEKISPLYGLLLQMFSVPEAKISMQVQRPLVYVTSDEKSLGKSKSNSQITSKLKNLLASNGFEFTDDQSAAELWFDVKANSEQGSVSGSIYITYLTSVIRVTAVKEGKEIYETTLDRIKGYGLDYNRSSIDAYNKAIEALEKERMNEIIANVLQ